MDRQSDIRLSESLERNKKKKNSNKKPPKGRNNSVEMKSRESSGSPDLTKDVKTQKKQKNRPDWVPTQILNMKRQNSKEKKSEKNRKWADSYILRTSGLSLGAASRHRLSSLEKNMPNENKQSILQTIQ